MNAAGIEGAQITIDDGHIIPYYFYRADIAGAVPSPIYKSVTFLCRVMQTSWTVGMEFERVPGDGSISCTVSIQRTDDGRDSMDVNFWMKVFPANIPIIDIPSITFRMQGMSCRREARPARRTFPRVIVDDVIRQMGDRRYAIQVSFGVKGCHRGERKEKDPRHMFEDDYNGFEGLSALFSKM